MFHALPTYARTGGCAAGASVVSLWEPIFGDVKIVSPRVVTMTFSDSFQNAEMSERTRAPAQKPETLCPNGFAGIMAAHPSPRLTPWVDQKVRI